MSKSSGVSQSGSSYGWVVVGAGAMMTCVGFGAMLSLAVFLPPISTAMGWSRSGVAVARVWAGMGVAPLTIAPSASWLITTYDWRTAMLAIGIASWALLIPASFLVRPAPKPTALATDATAVPETQWTVAQALR